MKKITMAAILISLTMMACQSTGEKTSNEKAKTEDAQPAVNAGAQEQSAEEAPEAPEEASMEKSTVLNANLATEEDMINAGLSEELIAAVLENRPFISMNDLDPLVGAEVDKEALYASVFVPFNLNTTAEEDFKMIPGVGDRMAHEFEEYRPYTSIQQFRREIGKYVDDAEVARYEHYVFVPIELNTASEEDIKSLPGVGDRMAHEFEEYRPYANMEQFRKEIGKYVDDKELSRLERFVYIQE